jgi:hypothetical protein
MWVRIHEGILFCWASSYPHHSKLEFYTSTCYTFVLQKWGFSSALSLQHLMNAWWFILLPNQMQSLGSLNEHSRFTVGWKMDATSEVAKPTHPLADFSCSHLASLVTPDWRLLVLDLTPQSSSPLLVQSDPSLPHLLVVSTPLLFVRTQERLVLITFSEMRSGSVHSCICWHFHLLGSGCHVSTSNDAKQIKAERKGDMLSLAGSQFLLSSSRLVKLVIGARRVWEI